MLRRVVDVRSKEKGTGHLVQATVSLRYDERHRRRFRMSDDNGEEFLLDLPHAALLADGDRLILERGGALRVRAAPEPVADLHVTGPAEAARLAWHIGNRHTPVQVLAGGVLRILDDHVLIDLAERHGARVERRVAPFSPEPGAYAGGDGHRNGRPHKHGEGGGAAHGHAH